MKKISALLFGLLFISSLSFGQYYYLTNAAPGQNPGGLNTDNEYSNTWAADGWTSILGPSVATPTWSAAQTIPFTFNFNGSPVTQYKVSSTGVLTFTTGAATVPGTTNAAIPSANIPDKSVCIWGLVASGANDEVVIKTFGTAPNRQQWIYFPSNTLGGAGWTYMSIVLEEGSDKIYLVEQRNYNNTGTITAGIQVDGTTAYFVAGSPSYTPLCGNDFSQADNVYYEFIYGTQATDDAELASLDLLPYSGAGNTNISGTINNLGSATITAMDITWNDGSGPQVDNLTGLNIASGASYNFTHGTPLNVVAGTSYSINVDVALTGDANMANNTLATSTVGLTQIPAKVVVGEEKTGTWCGWCPRGGVALQGMEATPSFIGIAVHNSDPMAVSSYDSGTASTHPDFTGYPHGAVDRAIGGDPGNFSTMHSTRMNAIVPCDVKNIVAEINQTTNMISVSADAEFYGNIPGNYRLSCVIVEDDIMTTGNGWSQANYYSFQSQNVALVDPVTGFDWQAANNPVANPADFGGYDHVARSLSNDDIMGDAGSLPAGTATLGVHSYSFTDLPSSTVNDYTKSHAIVMVVNATTGEILNAGSASISLFTGISDVAKSEFSVRVSPNPTTDVANISFNLDANNAVKMDVYNAVGSLVYTKDAGVLGVGSHKIAFDGTELNNGFYFVNLTIGEQVITKKVSLVK